LVPITEFKQDRACHDQLNKRKCAQNEPIVSNLRK